MSHDDGGDQCNVAGDDPGNGDLEKCLKAPALGNREEVTKEDDLEILSERENAENESRSEENQSHKNESRPEEDRSHKNESRSDKLDENAASVISQQSTSLEQNGQVRHYKDPHPLPL